MADYMAYALGRPETRVLALLLETVRDPEGFRSQLERAAETRRSGDRVEGGAHRGCEGDGDRALGRARGRARRVRGAVRRVRRARGGLARGDGRRDGAVLVAPSGRGRRARHRAPCATRAGSGRSSWTGRPTSGCRSPRSRTRPARRSAGSSTRGSLPRTHSTRGEPGTTPTGSSASRSSPSPPTPTPRSRRSSSISRGRVSRTTRATCRSRATSSRQTTKPFCVLSNLASAVALEEAAYLRDRGIPVLEGTSSGLVALRALLAHTDVRARPAADPPAPVADAGARALARAARDRRRGRASSRASRCWPTTACR